ncbi:unnamed protein product [marine sediment metagenome]|uniref:Uncharacterized protein n=1 Tax=marine sediment metagenome TaxID=412755 RepID=X0TVY6_9ZZZZ
MGELATRGRHTLAVMDISGHAEIAWNVEDYDSITNAKKMFDKLIKDGFQAFSVERDGPSVSKGGKITKFNPALEEIIMVPKVSGG